jgi:hypothetical protein
MLPQGVKGESGNSSNVRGWVHGRIGRRVGTRGLLPDALDRK